MRFLHVKPGGGWTKVLQEVAPVILGRARPPGRYLVRVLRDDEVAGEAEVLITRGRTVDLDIRIRR